MPALRPGIAALSAVGLSCLLYACGGNALPSAPTSVASASTTAAPAPTAAPPAPPTLPSLGGATLVGAGDIAMCALEGSGLTSQLMQRLLSETHGTPVTFGDNSNDNGSREMFDCFDRTWGFLRGSVLPSPGNHDYEADPAAPYYFQYFGNAGPPGLGYYSYDRGGWHILSLNTELPEGERQSQIDWLRNDLHSHRTECTLAYFHRPLFSSGAFASPRARAIFETLYKAGADVVLTGHEHFYAAFPPLNPSGAPDQQYGIREIIAGTGGARLFDRPAARYGETIVAGTWGILVFNLGAHGYDYRFVAVDGSVRDAGSGSCHDNPPGA
jgi:hypothetical protein